jgi:ElaB/YqjD/DUF883 family membrane-anchored ribosome-binding protein
MDDSKRTQLKEKVASAEKRNEDRGRTTIVDRAGERAIGAKDEFIRFAREHPLATVAGGLAIGVLVSGLFKRSPTRKIGRKAAKTAGNLATMGAELAVIYARQALEAANEAGHAGAEKLEELGSAARDAAREARRDASHRASDLGHRASDLGDAARTATRDAGKRLGKMLGDRFN